MTTQSAMIGRQNEHLTIIEVGHTLAINSNVYSAYMVKCECGTTRLVTTGNFFKMKSCGCLRRKRKSTDEQISLNASLYNCWNNMKARCYDTRYHSFHRYGGRGIKVCEEWKENYPAFREWALANGYDQQLELDRKNNNDVYSPQNCRFVTHAENCRNKSQRQKAVA